MLNDPEDKVVFSTRWFDVVERTCIGWQEPYYMVRSSDSVTVLATTTTGKVLLIRQYRPALDRYSLELPSGHTDCRDDSPEAAARRELLEETGYRAEGLELLGVLDPDVGRLTARLWCYFAPRAARVSNSQDGEEKIEVIECTPEEFLEWAKEGKLRHAQDLAIAFLAMSRGHLRVAGGRTEE
ncbi:MAG: NUDIX hydrolase [Bryobacterales bacterium]|nr:NUDIX hydrolase [Bryobacterales bacterium]